MKGAAYGYGLGRRRPGPPLGQGGGAAVRGMARTAFAGIAGLPAPAFHYHPTTDQVAVNAGNGVTGYTPAGGSPALTPTVPGGILCDADALGRKRLRWEPAPNLSQAQVDAQVGYLDIAPGALTWDNRAFTVFAVLRHHKGGSTMSVFGSSFANDGVTSPAVLTGRGFLCLNAKVARGQVGWSAQQVFFNDLAPASDVSYLTADTAISVVGVVGRASGAAGGALRVFANGRSASSATAAYQSAAAGAALKGGRIGGFTQQNGTPRFDLYEIVAFAGQLTDAQAQGVSDALMANWGVVQRTRQIVLEGDSLTDGVVTDPGGIRSKDSLGMWLTEPGMGLLPGDVRVINSGTSGNLADATFDTAKSVTVERDVAGAWPSMLLPGGAGNNICAVQIGFNDVSGGGANRTAAQAYASIVAYIADPANGLLAKGWSVVVVANQATAGSAWPRISELRALIRDPRFLTDCGAGAGQPFAGRVRVLDLPAITDEQGRMPFSQDTDVIALYTQTDGSHDTPAGARLKATGGTTPQHGYGSIL